MTVTIRRLAFCVFDRGWIRGRRSCVVDGEHSKGICEECGGVGDMAIGWFLPRSLGALMPQESWLLQLFLLARISASCPEVNSHHMQCFGRFLECPAARRQVSSRFARLRRGLGAWDCDFRDRGNEVLLHKDTQHTTTTTQNTSMQSDLAALVLSAFILEHDLCITALCYARQSIDW